MSATGNLRSLTRLATDCRLLQERDGEGCNRDPGGTAAHTKAPRQGGAHYHYACDRASDHGGSIFCSRAMLRSLAMIRTLSCRTRSLVMPSCWPISSNVMPSE